MNKIEDHSTPGPWYPVEYAGYWNIQKEPFYGATDLLNADDVEGNDIAEANCKLAAAAPEMRDFIADLLELSDVYGVILPNEIINRAETILKKSYNF